MKHFQTTSCYREHKQEIVCRIIPQLQDLYLCIGSLLQQTSFMAAHEGIANGGGFGPGTPWLDHQS